MVETAEGLCPHVLKRSSLRQELVRDGSGRMAVPRSFVTNTLLEQAGVDIVNKIRCTHTHTHTVTQTHTLISFRWLE